MCLETHPFPRLSHSRLGGGEEACACFLVMPRRKVSRVCLEILLIGSSTHAGAAGVAALLCFLESVVTSLAYHQPRRSSPSPLTTLTSHHPRLSPPSRLTTLASHLPVSSEAAPEEAVGGSWCFTTRISIIIVELPDCLVSSAVIMEGNARKA